MYRPTIEAGVAYAEPAPIRAAPHEAGHAVIARVLTLVAGRRTCRRCTSPPSAAVKVAQAMGLIARVLTTDRDGKLCRYVPSILGPNYTAICIVEIAGEDEPTEECPGFRFSKDSWHTGHHEHAVLIPNAAVDPNDSDWHVYRWGVGARYAYSSDVRFAKALSAILGKPWPESTAIRLADVVEKVM